LVDYIFIPSIGDKTDYCQFSTSIDRNLPLNLKTMESEYNTAVRKVEYTKAITLLLLANPKELLEEKEGELPYIGITDSNSKKQMIQLPGTKKTYNNNRDLVFVVPLNENDREYSAMLYQCTQIFVRKFNRLVDSKNARVSLKAGI